MHTLKASDLDETFIGLKAKITPEGSSIPVTGGISDVNKIVIDADGHCPVHEENHGPLVIVAVWIAGEVYWTTGDNTLEVELTPTEREATAARNGRIGHRAGIAISIAALTLAFVLTLIYAAQSTSIEQTALALFSIFVIAAVGFRVQYVASRVTRWV